jgi:hypothetical protein
VGNRGVRRIGVRGVRCRHPQLNSSTCLKANKDSSNRRTIAETKSLKGSTNGVSDFAFQATPVEVIRVLLQDQFWPEQITYILNMAWLSLLVEHTVVWNWKLFGIPSRMRSTVSTDTYDKS